MAVSRANLLLQKQLHRINSTREYGELPWGITAGPVLNDIFMWEGEIEGPQGTCWEGGLFKVRIIFDEDYDEVPPQVTFVTVPFHPNIEMHSGKPCWDLLDEVSWWIPQISILGILLSLQAMLVEPVLENPVNMPAAEIYIKSPRLYEQLVRDCVVASRRLKAGLPPHQEVEPVQSSPATKTSAYQPSSTNLTKIKQLSFDEYHNYWMATATSLPLSSNKRSRDIPFEPETINRSLLTEDEFRDLLKQQRMIWYGRFDKPSRPRKSASTRATKTPREVYNIPSPSMPALPPLPVPPPVVSTGSIEINLGNNNTLQMPLTNQLTNRSLYDVERGISAVSAVSASVESIKKGVAEDTWESEAEELEVWVDQLNESDLLDYN